jgi:hypothetical protein
MPRLAQTIGALAILLPPVLAQAQFTTHTIASDLTFGYQVLAADLNLDGRPDIVGLGAQKTELLWFENPGWEPHVITRGTSGMINMDAADLDGDAVPEIALAYGFSTNPARSTGNIALLRHGGDPTAPWQLTEIDTLPSSHRIRFGDVDGSGNQILVNAPILHRDASGFADPERLPTPLVAYGPDAWTPRTITTANQGVVHGVLLWDFDNDGSDEVLTAGRLGIHAHRPAEDGNWDRVRLAAGEPLPYPDGGSSDLAAGTLDGNPFLAAIEPFHGNQVVVYRPGSGEWQRQVIDTELVNGHSILVADLSGDGNGEIIAAGTRGPKNLYMYRAADAAGVRWERTIIDDAIAANSCVAADLNGDDLMDVVCIDNSAPFEIRWYENSGAW